MGGLTQPKGGETRNTTQTTQVPAYVQAAQGNLLNAANGVLSPFLQQQAFTTAPQNADQLAGYDLVRQLAQGAFTNPSYAPANNNTPSEVLTSALGGLTGATPATANTYSTTGYTATPYEASTATAAQLDPNAISKFMNPYIDNVLDPAVRQMRRQYGETQADIGARAAASGAYGGSRSAIQRGQADRAYGDQVASTVGGLLGQGYNTAAGLAQGNTNLDQQTRLANTGYLNSAAASNAAAQNTAAQFGASAQNTANAANAAAQNNMSQFNASQGLQRTQMQMSIAQALEGLRSNDQTRQMQAIQALLGVGNAQQQFYQQNLDTPLKYLQALAATTPQQYGSTTIGTQPNTAPSPLQTILGGGLSILGMGTGGGSTLLGNLIK